MKYMGIHLNDKLQWFSQCQFAASMCQFVASFKRVLNVLRRTTLGCDSEAKYRAYKAIVRPLLEYACVVWFPHAVKDVNLLEAVQRHAAWVAVTGTKLRTLGLFFMMCAIESCVYYPYLPGGTICQCVLFKTFIMLVLLSFKLLYIQHYAYA